MLFAEGMTFWDVIGQNIALIAGGISIAFAAISTGVGIYYREKWKADHARADKVTDHAMQLANAKALSEANLLTTLTNEFPKLATASEGTVRVLEKLCDGGSDIKRDLAEVHHKIGILAQAQIEYGCPDSKEQRAAALMPYAAKVAQRAEDMKHRPDAPPGFIQSVQ